MGYVILAAVAGWCAFNWLNRYVCNAAILLYMQKKGYEMPDSDEATECFKEAWLHVLHIK